jgi:hypothetical protein
MTNKNDLSKYRQTKGLISLDGSRRDIAGAIDHREIHLGDGLDVCIQCLYAHCFALKLS